MPAVLVFLVLAGCAEVAESCPSGQELLNGVCENIECTGGQQLVGGECVCPSGLELVEGSCQPGTGCTSSQTLVDGACVDDLCAEVECDDGDDCTQDVCDRDTGQCSYPDEPDDTLCDFGGLPGFCKAGVCEDAMLCANKDCDDEDVCTADGCNPANGECIHTPGEDGVTCPYRIGSPGVCFNGVCGCDPDGACNDLNDCTTEECDGVERICVTTDTRRSGSCIVLGGLPGCCSEGGMCVLGVACE